MSFCKVVCRWFLCALIGCCMSVAAVAQEHPHGKKEEHPHAHGQDEMMKAMMAAATPGTEHKQLASYAGTWTTSTKSWMGEGEPQVSAGECQIKTLLGGRFIVEEYKGTMMGMPFEGFGVTGYDNTTKQYQNVWMDTMGTAMMMSTGTCDASGKVLTMSGNYVDPASGQSTPCRMVTTTVDNKKHVFEMYMSAGDQEMKTLEITYTRK